MNFRNGLILLSTLAVIGVFLHLQKNANETAQATSVIAAQPYASLPVNVHTLKLPLLPYTPYSENPAGLTRQAVRHANDMREYYVYAPTRATNQPRPTILLLHGSGRTGISLVEKWKSLADEYDLILIGPTAVEDWLGDKDNFTFIDDVMADAKNKYPVDPMHTYIFGHSRGAQYGFYLALMRADVFAAAAVNAGYMKGSQDQKIMNEARNRVPFLVMTGTADKNVPPDITVATAQMLARNGFPTDLDLFEDHTHWYYDVAPYLNKMALDFLSRHTLEVH